MYLEITGFMFRHYRIQLKCVDKIKDSNVSRNQQKCIDHTGHVLYRKYRISRIQEFKKMYRTNVSKIQDTEIWRFIETILNEDIEEKKV